MGKIGEVFEGEGAWVGLIGIPAAVDVHVAGALRPAFQAHLSHVCPHFLHSSQSS